MNRCISACRVKNYIEAFAGLQRLRGMMLSAKVTGAFPLAGVRRVREELGQLSWFMKEYAKPSRWAVQAQVNRSIRLPKLARSRRVPGSVWAVGMVRNEEDVIGQSIKHLLAQGVDHVLIADNLSSDRTPKILADLAQTDPRVHVAEDTLEAFYQAEKTSRLARVAGSCGADWIIPFDADEFWFARGQTLKEFFSDCEGGMTYANFYHMVAAADDFSRPESAEFLIDATPSFPSKVAVRSHRLVVLLDGNHDAMRVGGVGPTGLHVAHAKYRSLEQMTRKFCQGTEAVMLIDPAANIAPHWRKGAAFGEKELSDIWETISSGEAEARIDHDAHGPMVSIHPLAWGTWDPEDQLPVVPERRP